MKAILAMSTVCATVSLLGLFGLSVMSVAPGGESWHKGMMLAVGVFLVGWSLLALGMKRQLRLQPGTVFSPAAKAATITVGAVYVLLVLLCSVG
jgi:hypothetical protein